MEVTVEVVGGSAGIPGDDACPNCPAAHTTALGVFFPSCVAGGVGSHTRAKGFAYQAVAKVNETGTAIDGSPTYHYYCLEPPPAPQT